MQPQDTGGAFDWGHLVSGLGGGLLTAIAGALGWIYKAGGKEPALKAELQKSLVEAEIRVENKVDDMAGHFREAFDGIRRQIDEHKLHTVENFVRWPDFNRLRQEDREAAEERRKENRQAFDRLERKIDQILGRQP